jgi:hypothetical protein
MLHIQWFISLFLYMMFTQSVSALVVNFSVESSNNSIPLYVTLSTRNQIVPSPGFAVSGYQWQLSGPETRELAGVAEQVVQLNREGTYTITLIATEFAIQGGGQVTNTGSATKTITVSNSGASTSPVTSTSPSTPIQPVSGGKVWPAPAEPSNQGYIPIERFRSDDGNLWQTPLRFQPSVVPNGSFDATQFTPEASKHAIEGFFQIRYACEASWYSGAKDLAWIPANVIGAIEYCVYPANVAEVINYLRSTANSLACSAGLEPC